MRLIRADETRDRFRSAVREARVAVEVNGVQADLVCATYRLPVTVDGVQVDCPATNALAGNARSDAWGLDKRARLRLWRAGSPWIEPDRFRYPARQKCPDMSHERRVSS